MMTVLSLYLFKAIFHSGYHWILKLLLLKPPTHFCIKCTLWVACSLQNHIFMAATGLEMKSELLKCLQFFHQKFSVKFLIVFFQTLIE